MKPRDFLDALSVAEKLKDATDENPNSGYCWGFVLGLVAAFFC